jgi:hypothetical protein
MLPAQNNTETLQEKLASHQWKKRVILVIASTEGEPDFLAQQKLLESKQSGTQERDLEILYLVLNKLNDTDKTFLRKSFSIDTEKFCIILIGKDGGEKRRSTKPLQAEELFQTIDAMPMRQQEMRNRNK